MDPQNLMKIVKQERVWGPPILRHTYFKTHLCRKISETLGFLGNSLLIIPCPSIMKLPKWSRFSGSQWISIPQCLLLSQLTPPLLMKIYWCMMNLMGQNGTVDVLVIIMLLHKESPLTYPRTAATVGRLLSLFEGGTSSHALTGELLSSSFRSSSRCFSSRDLSCSAFRLACVAQTSPSTSQEAAIFGDL